MISFLEGNIEYLGDNYVILRAGSIGYKVRIIPKLVRILSKSKSQVKLYIHSQLNQREGIFDMYGFNTMTDLDLFTTLIGVSGIGPKNALNIMSNVDPTHLQSAVTNDDDNYLRKVSNLGPKTAKRLILELKNKIDYLNLGNGKDVDLKQESNVIDALLALGYGMSEIKDTLKEVKAVTVEERVREALSLLGKK